jgi:hypothetical protein
MTQAARQEQGIESTFSVSQSLSVGHWDTSAGQRDAVWDDSGASGLKRPVPKVLKRDKRWDAGGTVAEKDVPMGGAARISYGTRIARVGREIDPYAVSLQSLLAVMRSAKHRWLRRILESEAIDTMSELSMAHVSSSAFQISRDSNLVSYRDANLYHAAEEKL